MDGVGGKVAPLLVFACGNPSRGDDALGPAFTERAAARLHHQLARGEIELLTDFQLQVEHALDLVGRRQVVFVDASVSCAPPFEYADVRPTHDRSFSTHALSPGAVLEAHRVAVGGEPPAATLLSIRGERFGLGEPLSESAERNLQQAVAFFVEFVASRWRLDHE